MSEKKPTTRRPITLDDINAIDYIDQYKKIEVVDGDWNHDDVPFYRSHSMLSGVIQATTMTLLHEIVKQHGLGQIYSGSVGYVLEGSRENIQLMRRTDVSFVKKEHLRNDKRDEPFYQAPDLVVEVLFEDFAEDMFRRIHDFLSHGTAQVWVIIPLIQQLWVFLPNGSAKVNRVGDSIPVGDLLPGFTLDVATVFAE